MTKNNSHTPQNEKLLDLDKILSAKKQNPQADTSGWEREIDQLVYGLYGLSEEEIGIIENEQKEAI